jgi:hypothetical protein
MRSIKKTLVSSHAPPGSVTFPDPSPPPPPPRVPRGTSVPRAPGITYQQRALSFVALTVTEIHYFYRLPIIITSSLHFFITACTVVLCKLL